MVHTISEHIPVSDIKQMKVTVNDESNQSAVLNSCTMSVSYMNKKKSLYLHKIKGSSYLFSGFPTYIPYMYYMGS